MTRATGLPCGKVWWRLCRPGAHKTTCSPISRSYLHGCCGPRVKPLHGNSSLLRDRSCEIVAGPVPIVTNRSGYLYMPVLALYSASDMMLPLLTCVQLRGKDAVQMSNKGPSCVVLCRAQLRSCVENINLQARSYTIMQASSSWIRYQAAGHESISSTKAA